MKTLLLHCDYLKFRALKKALKKIEDLPDSKKSGESKDCLAIFMAVEKGDSSEAVDKLLVDVKKHSKDINAKNVVLYPYAHLSKDLSSPDKAVELMDYAEGELKKNFKVVRAPFGYYKEFEIKVKGHPLSELSREIHVEGKESESYDYKQLLREVSKAKLDTSKLKENDHRIIGRQMDLFSFNDVAPGMVFWHNNGIIVRNGLIDFARDVLSKQGYEEISTPQIMDKKLWQISGHWDKYKDNNFVTQYEDRPFLVKPMNCPGGMLVYKAEPKSYKDLPLRVGEFGIVHRQELSGVLAGLFRVVQFIQDDAHVFCTEKQLDGEIERLIDLVIFFYEKFNLKFDHIELSTRPEKRIGDDKIWDKAEKALEKALKKKKVKYKVNKGDGAFYGPKIDFHVKDSLKRSWQLGTIQLDFAMPERFELEYTDRDNKRKRPIMLHRAIYGSLERFIGILIEHFKGRFPTWIAPMQVRVLSFTDRNQKYGEEVIKKLASKISSLRVDADFAQTTVPSKVKQAEIMRIPYVIVVGDREEEEKSIAVRIRGDKKIHKFSVEEFAEKLKKEIDAKE